jgi:DNA-binding response OmpR family regulator
MHVVTGGLAALRFLDAADDGGEASCPGLVILDIRLPKMRGEVLQRIRAGVACSAVPVLVVSTSGSDTDLWKTFR